MTDSKMKAGIFSMSTGLMMGSFTSTLLSFFLSACHCGQKVNLFRWKP